MALAQASENVLISPLAGDIPPTTSLPHSNSPTSEWQVTLVVMPELASSLSYLTQAYEAQNPIEPHQALTTDCSFLANQLPENGYYLYATLGQNEHSAIAFYKCTNSESTLLGVLLVDAEKLKDGYPIDSLAYENLKNLKSGSSSIIQNLCEIGSFNPRFSKCLNHNKFQRALIDDYNSVKALYGIAYAINQALSDPTGLPLADFTTIKGDFDTLIGCGGSSCTGGACNNPGESLVFLEAAATMLKAAKVVGASVTKEVANSIREKIGCVQYSSDLKSFSELGMCKVNYAIYTYFDFFMTVMGSASDDYKTAHQVGSDILDQIWISYIKGGEGSFVVNNIILEFKNSECMGALAATDKNIITQIRIRYGDSLELPGTGCDYQVATDIIAMMEYIGQNFGPDSDGYYWKLYKIGSIVGTDNTYSDTTDSLSIGGCFGDSLSKLVKLNYYKVHDGWVSFSWDNSGDLTAGSSPDTQALSLKFPGQYLIKPTCTGKVLDVLLLTCGCDKSCATCVDLNTCTTCATTLGFVDSNNIADDGKCVCPDGKYDDGTKCANCPTNCKTCSSGTVCLTCDPHYAIDFSVKANYLCYIGKQFFRKECLKSTKFDNFGYLLLESECQFPLFKSLTSGTTEGEDCSNYFGDTGSLGTGPKCTLRTPYIIQVNLGTDPKIGTSAYTDVNALTPKDELEMKTGVYSLWKTWKIEAALITTPTPSIVSISGYSNIDKACLINADTHPIFTSTLYGVYRSKFTFSWSNNGGITFTDSVAENAQFVINSLTAGSTFTVTLVVTDPITTTVTETKSITEKNPSFMFSLSTGSRARYYKSTPFTIYPVNINNCQQGTSMGYIWTIVPDVASITKNNQILNIPKGALDVKDYEIELEITIGTIKVKEKTKITIVETDIVIILDKGYIIATPAATNTVISAAKSYDPDSPGTPLTCTWTSWPATVIPSTSASSVNIPYANYPVSTDYTSFTVFLTVSNGGKSSKTYITVEVGNYADNPSLVSITPKKIKYIDYFTLQAKHTGASATVAWALSSGPYSTKTSDSSYLTFSPKTLVESKAYSFNVVYTVSGLPSSMSCFFRVNGLPSCSKEVILNPTTGNSLLTGFNFMLPSCVDSDNEDLPLSYKIAALKPLVTCCSTLLTSARGDPNIFNFKISKTFKKIEYIVSDALGDSMKKSSADITINARLRQLKESEDLINVYYDLIISQEVVPVIVMMLDEYTIPEDLLDIMWSDFKKNIGNFTGQDYSEVVSSVVISFLDTNQNPMFIQKRLVEYISFLEVALSSIEHYDEVLNERVALIAERTMLLQPEITDVVQAKSIIQKLFNIQSILGTDGVSVNTARVSAYEVENFNDMLSASPIILGLNTITVGDLEVENSDIIRIEAMSFAFGQFSNIVDIEIKSLKSSDNGEIIDHDTVYIEVPDDELIIVMKYYGIINVKCSSYKDGLWNGDDCNVKSAENGEAKVSIKRSCTFQLFDKNPVYTSKVPLYLIFSLIIAMAIFMPFMIYLDKNIPYLKVPTAFSVTIETKSEREEKVGIETDRDQSEISSILQYHLLISMFKNDVTLLRSRKLLILLTNIVFALFIQVLLLKFTTISNIAVGVISALIALVPSSLCIALFRGRGTAKLAAGAVIILLVNIASVIGAFLIQGSSGWLISWLVGLATELIVSQSIVMIGTKIITH